MTLLKAYGRWEYVIATGASPRSYNKIAPFHWCQYDAIIRAKRVSNCYIQEKKNCPSARVHACSTNLGFSVEKNVLVLV